MASRGAGGDDVPGPALGAGGSPAAIRTSAEVGLTFPIVSVARIT